MRTTIYQTGPWSKLALEFHTPIKVQFTEAQIQRLAFMRSKILNSNWSDIFHKLLLIKVGFLKHLRSNSQISKFSFWVLHCYASKRKECSKILSRCRWYGWISFLSFGCTLHIHRPFKKQIQKAIGLHYHENQDDWSMPAGEKDFYWFPENKEFFQGQRIQSFPLFSLTFQSMNIIASPQWTEILSACKLLVDWIHKGFEWHEAIIPIPTQQQ